jgi:hypothetical protein
MDVCSLVQNKRRLFLMSKYIVMLSEYAKNNILLALILMLFCLIAAAK